MAPQVGTMSDGLVVDLDDAVGEQAVERRARFAREFDDAGVVLIDAQLGGAGQHAVAFHPVDDLLADGRPGGNQARPAIGRAANHRPAARGSGIDERLHVVAVGDGLDRFHARQRGTRQQLAGRRHAFALGGLHGDQPFQRSRSLGQPGD